MGILSREELLSMGFAAVGKDVRISDRASIYGVERIIIGDRVRVDDFCILSAGPGGIRLGNHIHIAAFSSLIGAGQIELQDFANLSARVSIYSSSDDYSGSTMTNPMVPNKYKDVNDAPVRVGRHTIIGAGSVVLPGVQLGEGAAVGALSLVRRDCEPFGIYGGVPAALLGHRKKDLLSLERAFLTEISGETG